MGNDVEAFELHIYKNRDGKWVARARTGELGKNRYVGCATELSAEEISLLKEIAHDGDTRPYDDLYASFGGS